MGRRVLAVVFLCLALAVTACAQAAPLPTASPTPPPTPAATQAPVVARSGAPGGQPGAGSNRVSGAVQAVGSNQITLADGTVLATTAQTRVTRLEAITAADLQAGQYVAVTAQRQPDNTLLASIVNVFDESLRGVGPGQRPMTGGNLMTNATIAQVTGDAFTVTWDGGGASVKLAPDAKVERIVVGSLSDVKPGGNVSASVANGVAQSISLQ